MFGFTPFASSAFADVKDTNRILVELTGVSAEAIDDGAGVSAGGSISVPVFEDPATGAVGTVAISVKNNVVTVGVSSVGDAATPNVSGTANSPVTGVEAAVSLTSVAPRANASTTAAGVETLGATGTVATPSGANVSATGVSSICTSGTATAIVTSSVVVTDVGAQGAVTAPTVVASSQVLLVGVQATGKITTPLIWNAINDNQTPNWVQTRSGNRFEGAKGGLFGFGSIGEVPFASLGFEDVPEEPWRQVNDGSNVVWVQIPT